MRNNADRLQLSIQVQTDGTDERIRTNADIEEIMKQMNGLIDRLDVLVRNKYRNDPAKLSA